MLHGEDDVQYNWINGAESLEKYKLRGYHPIMIGDMLHKRYRIVDKLGFGGYSTVWLAKDTRLNHYVAVKVGIANSLPHESKILRALLVPQPSSLSTHPGRKSIPLPLDEFELRGPNGTHPCYTMTPARCNLREVSFSRLFPLEVTRALSAGLTLAIAYMHSQGYVHGDIHLRNVLVKLPSSFDQLPIEQLYETYGKPQAVPVTRCDGKPLPPNVPATAVIPHHLGKDAEEFSLSDAEVLLSDFGEAFSPALNVRLGESCHTPLAMRPPEARFEPQSPLSFSADIWSLATTIWEILGMKAIFSTGGSGGTNGASSSTRMDTQEDRDVWPPIDEAFEEGIQRYRRKRGMGVFEVDETAAILDLMRRMLAFRPEQRPTAEEILKSEWMVKWALPALTAAR
ncbi:hypothetical protein D8B26_007992 [Coccidioides posadasii str. Silveira]|uniref:uncharacterized protein n=1 Tax=Coccidioides posadasii (strain RMSCC 757 / Silveira) TaxID=443226 RepID=UPI001BEDB03D|nr:hypothetical protein D8B26_007992 [Coccidioides posadasii str. Silveira]